MNREEILNAIANDKTMPFIQPEQLAEIVDFTIKNYQPSLPANLDEAAEEAYPKMSRLSEPHGVIPADNKTHYLGDANEENRVAFKAGAMWDRAKMMETAVDGRVIKSYNPVTAIGQPTLHGIELIYPDEGKPYLVAGDEVKVIVVQGEE